MEFQNGDIVRIKETGEIGCVATVYFWGKVGVVIEGVSPFDRNSSKWFNREDDALELIERKTEEK